METLEIQRVRGTNGLRRRPMTRGIGADRDAPRHLFTRTATRASRRRSSRTPTSSCASRAKRSSRGCTPSPTGTASLCLRPEFTASVIRAYVNHLQDRPLPLRLAYAGPTFRYEKPQRGRYRQFTEVGGRVHRRSRRVRRRRGIAPGDPGAGALGLTGERLVVGHLGVVLAAAGPARHRRARPGADPREHGAAGSEAGRSRTEVVERDRQPGRRRAAAATTWTPTSCWTRTRSSLPTLLREFGPRGAAQVTADLLQRANLSLEAGTRTPEEIVERLLAKAAGPTRRGRSRTAAAFILRLHELAGPPEKALPALRSCCASTPSIRARCARSRRRWSCSPRTAVALTS